MNEQINKANENRLKLFYSLTELTEITGLKTRALKYRMLEVKKKYNNIPNLLCKEGRTWKIHYSIIDNFLPKYTLKSNTVLSENWQSTSSWNTRDSYSLDYHIQLVNEIKTQLPKHQIAYTIEVDKRNIYHVHLISSASKDELSNVVENVIKKYLDIKKECRIVTDYIRNKISIIIYIIKAMQYGRILH